ncbi:MAG: putative immunity protein, partial [Promethearchaeota archaeon]
MKLKKEKSKFLLTEYRKDKRIVELVNKTDKKTLSIWAIDCVERVLPYYEKKYPKDHRLRNAIETLQTWINTGFFKMAVIRKASLDAHAAAREVGEDNAARSAAR